MRTGIESEIPRFRERGEEPPSSPERLPLGRRLLLGAEQGGLIGQLAAAAKADHGFPMHGDPQQIRQRLNTLGADPDMHEALDDAELDWASY